MFAYFESHTFSGLCIIPSQPNFKKSIGCFQLFCLPKINFSALKLRFEPDFPINWDGREHAIKIIITHIDTAFGKFRYYSVLDQSFHMDGQSDRGTLFYRLCLSRLLLPVTFIFGLHKVTIPEF